jgi:hypothetical protein
VLQSAVACTGCYWYSCVTVRCCLHQSVVKLFLPYFHSPTFCTHTDTLLRLYCTENCFKWKL